jgi:hypothetical protein
VHARKKMGDCWARPGRRAVFQGGCLRGASHALS